MLLKKAKTTTFKGLIIGALGVSGRNAEGKITIRHRGSGVFRLFRVVDFLNYIWNVRALVLSFHYNPYNMVLLSLVSYTNSVFSYRPAPTGLNVSNVIISANFIENKESRIAHCANLNFIKPGLYLNNIELKSLKGSQYTRSSQNSAKLVSTAENYSIVKLRSKVLLKISNLCTATIGILSTIRTCVRVGRNAGYTRRLGYRPTVRGVAMNPIDHPHGGGQGKTSGGRPSVTPWAKITKGKKTKKKINYAKTAVKR